MSIRINCPTCGATSILPDRSDREGCWHCNVEKEKFQEFMGLDDEDRWRRIWEAAGKPSAY